MPTIYLVFEAHVRLAAQLVVVDGRVYRPRRLVRYEPASLEAVFQNVAAGFYKYRWAHSLTFFRILGGKSSRSSRKVTSFLPPGQNGACARWCSCPSASWRRPSGPECWEPAGPPVSGLGSPPAPGCTSSSTAASPGAWMRPSAGAGSGETWGLASPLPAPSLHPTPFWYRTEGAEMSKAE